MDIGHDTIIHPNIKSESNAKIANNCWIDDMGEISIGNETYIGGHVRIYRHHHQEAELQWSHSLEKNFVVSDLVIGDHVFIGYGVVILPGCTYIGNSSVIGINSVVTKDVGDNEIWAGNPARKIRDRKIVGLRDTLVKDKS